MPTDSRPGNPVFVASGLRGARKRWAGHEPKTVTLASLTPEQRRLIVALIEAARTAPQAAA